MKNLKNFNYRLFFTLVLISLLPVVYTTVRIHFLGNLPIDWGVNIASQLAWVNIIYEVIYEALILPLFFLIGKSLENKSELENKVRTGIISSFIIYFTIAMILMVLAKPMLIFMLQKESIIQASTNYIRLEVIAILLSILYKFVSVVLVALKRIFELLIVLLSQMILTIILDVFLVSALPISLDLGVNGIAIGNIIVNLLLFFIGLFLLKNSGINVFCKSKLSFLWQKEWWKKGSLSGLESFVRNTAFIVMILKMINLVQAQGNFWIANHFIWGFLLIPVLSLGELIKRDVGANPVQEEIKNNFFAYCLITLFIVVFWLLTIPIWKLFIHEAMNVKDFVAVFDIVILSIGFYIIFAFNNIVDSIFYGLGRTDLMLWQSLIVSIFFYGSCFVLFQFGLFIPTLTNIIYMFGIGITLDSIITFFIYFYLLKRNKLVKL